jgi:hypothetical protein
MITPHFYFFRQDLHDFQDSFLAEGEGRRSEGGYQKSEVGGQRSERKAEARGEKMTNTSVKYQKGLIDDPA